MVGKPPRQRLIELCTGTKLPNEKLSGLHIEREGLESINCLVKIRKITSCQVVGAEAPPDPWRRHAKCIAQV